MTLAPSLIWQCYDNKYYNPSKLRVSSSFPLKALYLHKRLHLNKVSLHFKSTLKIRQTRCFLAKIKIFYYALQHSSDRRI